MKNNLIIIFITISFSLWSCSNGTNLILKASEINTSVDGGSPVIVNGLTIGKIIDLSLSVKGEIIMEALIDPEIKIPLDSQFILDADLLGSSQIKVEFGIATQYFQTGDSVDVVLIKSTREQFDLFDIPKTQEKLDTIINELKKLNSKIKGL